MELPVCFRFRHPDEIRDYVGTYEYYALIDMNKKSNLPIRAWKDLTLKVPPEDYNAYVACDAYKKNVVNNVTEGRGLFIFGGVGSGKTVWTYKIARHYMETIAGKNWDDSTTPVYFANVPRLLDDLRASMRDDAALHKIDRAMTEADLVILDDLGAENATEWAREKLYQYIDYRYANCKAMVITSNKGLDALDERIADRIRGTCEQVEFRMESKRQLTAQGGK